MPAPAASDHIIDSLRQSLSAGVTAAECGFFFDFDGTLAPIQLDPEAVAPAPGVAERLARLVEIAGVVALVSARPVWFLAAQFATIGNLRFFGLYGLEAASGQGRIETHPAAERDAELIATLADRAERELPAGASVERKRVTVALHYRAVPHLAGTITGWAETAGREHGLTVQPGRMVVELKPAGSPTKGSVVTEIASGLRVAWYFGDDMGDVPAFRALRELRETRPEFDATLVAVHNAESGQELAALSDLVLPAPSEIPGLLDRVLEVLSNRAT